MNVFLWIIQGFLCLAFLGAGGTKLVSPKDKLATRMAWSQSWPPVAIKALGAAEILGALGGARLVLPWATGIARVLTPIAAVGLAATMAGGIAVHLRRREYRDRAPTAILLVLSAVVAAGRF